MTVHRRICDCGEHVTLEADHWLDPCWVSRMGEITECCPMCGHTLEDAGSVWAEIEKVKVS